MSINPDIMAGYGWEDICIQHGIVEPEKQDRVREYVLHERQPEPFRIDRWRRVSGHVARHSYVGRTSGKDLIALLSARPGRDLLDHLHAAAKQNLDLSLLHRRFPQVNPIMLEYWMRSNGYIRNSRRR